MRSWRGGGRVWNQAGFRLSRSKTEYLRCGFSGVEREGGEATMDGVVLPRVEKFKYLGSIFKER